MLRASALLLLCKPNSKDARHTKNLTHAGLQDALKRDQLPLHTSQHTPQHAATAAPLQPMRAVRPAIHTAHIQAYRRPNGSWYASC